MNNIEIDTENTKNSLRFLYIGEIVGKTGASTVRKILPKIKQSKDIDFVIANGSSVTNGSGIGKVHALSLRKFNIDVVTSGEAAFFKKDILEVFPKSPWLLRPFNYPKEVPGHGCKICKTPIGNVAVLQLLGQSGFQKIHLENPFNTFDSIYERLKADAKIIIVDFRAPTTAEKRAFIYHVDGRVSAVFGSFSKVLTADAHISEKGTASISDAGRTGAIFSVCGMDVESRIHEYISGVRTWSKDAEGPSELQGCIVEIDKAGIAKSIETIRIPFKGENNE